MKERHIHFKCALRACHNPEKKNKTDAFASAFKEHSTETFWENIKKATKHPCSNPQWVAQLNTDVLQQ